jgi:methionyl-tRNA formyltransferase
LSRYGEAINVFRWLQKDARNDRAESMVQPTVLVSGYRGTAFVSGIVEAGLRPQRVISYKQVGDQSGAFERVVELTRAEGIPFEEARYPTLKTDKLIFLVGWQYLINEGVERCIVFHDSLLPMFRGFAPTVTALLRGDEEIGVTAFRPNAGVDTGPIYARRTVRVPPGASLQTVLDLQTIAMIELALELAERADRGELAAVLQDESAATYSLWRDAFDFFVDWRRDAQQVLRHINYVGFPYDGAKGVLHDRVLTIVKARLGPDIAFAIREPGKLWQIEDGRGLIVCGAGTVWIDGAIDADRKPFRFKNLRTRFLTADTAWIAPLISRSS